MQEIVMKFFYILFFTLTPVLCGRIVIDHKDKYDRSSEFINEDGQYHANIIQPSDGGLYFHENSATGVIVTLQATQVKNKENEVVDHRNTVSHDGRYYEFNYYTEDKQQREETGDHKEIEGSDSLTVDGTFSYIDTNGNQYIQGYTADKNGFHTKVAFGTEVDILHTELKLQEPPAEPPAYSPPIKGIDSALLCSLAGSGCK